MRIGATGKTAGKVSGAAGLGLDELLGVDYGALIGDEVISPSDLAELARQKAPLVRFRGAWVAVDPRELAEIKRRMEQAPGRVTLREAVQAALAGESRQGELVAVVRFDREPGTDRAEYAAVVADRWQGHGLGREMTLRLIAAARRKGVRRLYAFVLPENARMLGLLRDLGLPERIRFADGVDRVEVDLVDYQG